MCSQNEGDDQGKLYVQDTERQVDGPVPCRAKASFSSLCHYFFYTQGLSRDKKTCLRQLVSNNEGGWYGALQYLLCEIGNYNGIPCGRRTGVSNKLVRFPQNCLTM